MDRRLKDLDKRIKAEWGPGWDKLGPALQAAVRAQAVLTLVYAQDDSTDHIRLRALIEEGRAWAWQPLDES